MPIGCCASCFVGDKLGRKEIILAPHILSWILLASSNSHYLLYWSFVTLGFSAIVLSIPIMMYVRKDSNETRYMMKWTFFQCEFYDFITTIKFRHRNMHHTIVMSGLISSAITGFIIMFIMGMYFSWQQKTLFGFIVNIWMYFMMSL